MKFDCNEKNLNFYYIIILMKNFDFDKKNHISNEKY